MRKIYLASATVLALCVAVSISSADSKQDQSAEKAWKPTQAIGTLADVAEVEPNNPFIYANVLGCGNTLRPASISAAARDSDYVSFTANAGDLITFGTDADGPSGQVGDTFIRLLAADGSTVLASDDDSGPGLYSLIVLNAPYTGTYYGEIHAYSAAQNGGYKAFVTCQTPQPPPVNDQCSGALTIPCGDINLSGSTQYAFNDYSPITSGLGGCTGYSAQGNDVAYKVNVTVPGTAIGLTYTSTADGSIYIVTQCANPENALCVAGSDATITNQPEVLGYNFPAVGTYYVILDSFGTNTFGNWTLTGHLDCPVPAQTFTWGRLKTIYR